MVDRFSDGYFWGIIDVKGIISGSSKCYENSIQRDFIIPLMSYSVLPRFFFLTLMILVGFVFSSIGFCHSTSFWLWTSDSVGLFSFLSQGSHEYC